MQRFEQFVERLGAFPEVEFVLELGDFIFDGPPTELAAALDRLGRPVHVLYGNNDYGRLEDYQRVLGPRDWAFDHAGCRFVGLWNCLPPDRPDNHRGAFSAEQWAFLEERLASAEADGCRRTILATHVPPACPHGLNPAFFMHDDQRDRLYATCRGPGPAPDACLFGHVHQDDTWRVGRTEMIVTPSLNWNFVAEEPLQAPKRTRCTVIGGGYFRIVTVEPEGVAHTLHRLEPEA